MSHRVEQVADQLRRELSKLLRETVRNDLLRSVTVTRVRMTADLKVAHVYFDCPGSAEERVEVEGAFAKAAGYLRREIGHHMTLRYVPELYFHYDESRCILERTDKILKEVHSDDSSDRT